MIEPLYHLPCFDCGSSDALTDYGTHTHCYSCSSHNSKKEEIIEEEKEVRWIDNFPTKNHFEPISLTLGPIPDRGITEETCKKYGVGFSTGGDQVYPYYTAKGELIAYKFRKSPKGFLTKGDISHGALFGQQLFPAGSSKQITITEGELDALAAYQMAGSRYPVVSVKNAATAKRDCVDSFEYLNSFEQIVINFDKDEPHKHPTTGEIHYPGQEAAQAVASLFPLGKIRILCLEKAKDAADYCKEGLSREYVDEWWKAPTWTPRGLRFADDLWEEVSADESYETILYPWDGLNELTYGIRLSELTTFTADPKIGKSALLREVAYSALKNTDSKIGLIFLEEPNKHTIKFLMSLEANKPLHLPDVAETVSKEELRTYFDAMFHDKRVILYNHFGSNAIDEILNQVRYMAALGCKYIILDHLSIVVSDQSGDERKRLDEIATKLKTICMELNIAVLTVIHQNRKGEIRGTMGIEQLSNIVIKLFRNKLDEDPWRRNITKVVVQDNRFCGRTGPACYLYYEPTTGRLSELSKVETAQFENISVNKVEDIWE